MALWPAPWRANLPWGQTPRDQVEQLHDVMVPGIDSLVQEIEKKVGRIAVHEETDCSAWTTAASAIDLFGVTGDVLVRVFATVQTGLTSASDDGTIAVGVEGNVGVLLPATTVAGVATRLDAGDVWTDADANEKAIAIPDDWVLVNDTDIILTVGTNNITAGAMTVYCEWIPLSDGATVVSA